MTNDPTVPNPGVPDPAVPDPAAPPAAPDPSARPDGSGSWPTLPAGHPSVTDPLAVPGRRALAPEQPAAAPAPQPAQPVVAADSNTLPSDAAQQTSCPHCGTTVASYAAFCEACGGPLTPTTAPPNAAKTGAETPLGESTSDAPGAPTQSGPVTQPLAPPAPDDDEPQWDEPAQRGCAECGGVVGPDGYCTSCGAKATRQRDHYLEAPAPWVGGVCDRGLRHARNEDAMALSAQAEPGSRAVLVVCDGVSTSQDSDVASLAAARRARAVLDAFSLAPSAPTDAADEAVAQALADAAEQANQAVVDTTAIDSPNAASCTFVAAVIAEQRCYVANVGDSRAYWLPDEGDALLLTVDDSVAQARIAMGVSREEAEHGYQAHAITKWLGRDADDVAPRTTVFQAPAPGWLCVCSDGLWNYCSEATELRDLLIREAGDAHAPSDVADKLVQWACAQGGKDNITVALARLTPTNKEQQHG